MISLPHFVRVFLHAPATDLRKGFDALCGLVTTDLGQDPTSGHLFLFVNRRRDRLRVERTRICVSLHFLHFRSLHHLVGGSIVACWPRRRLPVSATNE
jgi:IS66 Orf2 like protein